MKVESLGPGAVVKAAAWLDEKGANVRPGELGVVFRETNFHGDGGGPMVRWFSGGCCNVYEGEVEIIIPRYEWNRSA